jgi:hypothetical protein
MPCPKNLTTLLGCAALGLLIATTVANAADNPPKSARHYDVAAYIWPSYHPDDRARMFWPDGIGEWQTVQNDARPNDPDYHPAHPLWGYVNEANRDVMEMEINAAADHGVNVFIFDWYWYDRMPFLEGCLNDGYLQARNNSRVKFYLMWANHDATLIWDKRNADDAFTHKNNSVVWKGAITPDEFERIAQRFITKYFSQPTYYKIDGKPVLMIFDLQNFVATFGSVDAARKAVDRFRQETIAAGFKGLEFQIGLRRAGSTIALPGSGERLPQADVVRRLGFDSGTHYEFVLFTSMNGDYADAVRDAKAEWARCSQAYGLKYYPHVSIGWDPRPRAHHFRGASVHNNTPEEFEKALIAARDFVDAHPDQAPLITINSWNEWTETSYLEPSDQLGYAYLDAVKRVFPPRETP